MSSIMITLRINMVTTQGYYSLTLIVWCIKLKLEIFMKILVWIKKYLILVVILQSKILQWIKKNVVTTISHNKYKDVLLNNECLIHSMNWIQSKNQRIGTYSINKKTSSCFDDKMYIQNNGYVGLALGY